MQKKHEYRIFFPSSNQLASKDSKTQKQYMEDCLDAVNEAAKKYNDKEIKTFHDLMGFLADKRKKLVSSNAEHKKEFGTLRVPNTISRTLISDSKINRYSEQFADLRKKFGGPSERNEELAIPYGDEGERTLSNIRAYTKESINYFEITHTIIENSYFIRGELSQLQENFAYDFQNDTDEVLYQELGKVAWHLANFMPYQRGSAAIVDMFIRALLVFYQKPLYPFKQGPSYDLIAMFTTDVNEYAEKFHALFATSQNDLRCFNERCSRYLAPDNSAVGWFNAVTGRHVAQNIKTQSKQHSTWFNAATGFYVVNNDIMDGSNSDPNKNNLTHDPK